MTSMPLTLRTMFGCVHGSVFDQSKGGRPFGWRLARAAGLPPGGGGLGLSSAAPTGSPTRCGAVSFLSARYLSAPALTIGLRICSSAWYQSLLKFHLVPSQVWMRAQVEPMVVGAAGGQRAHHAVEAQRVELLLVEVQVLQAPAHLLAGHHLALAEALLRAAHGFDG